MPEPASASDYQVKASIEDGEATVRVIDLVTDLVTASKEITLKVVGSNICTDIARDVIKVAAVDRTHLPGKTFTGFLKGFHLQSGAFACSASWDASAIIVAGANEQDMAAAVNRIRDLQGGAVVTDHGEVVAELGMPILGLSARIPIEDIVEQLQNIQLALKERGVVFPDPLLTLITLTGAAIPFIRISEEGLVNLKNGRMEELVVEFR